MEHQKIPDTPSGPRAPLSGIRLLLPLVVCPFLLILTGCGTIRRAMMTEVVDAFAGEAAMAVYTSDNDPELVWDALPFALKTMEMLRANDPRNVDLHAALAQGFVIYAHGHLSWETRKMENTDFRKAREMRKRVRRLSLRGRNYALEGLDLRHPGIERELRAGNPARLSGTGPDDIPLLYWGAAGWAGTTAADKGDMVNMAELPVAEAMMRRVIELDDAALDGAPHEFFIAYEAARYPAGGGSLERAKEHFKKALKYGGGNSASPYVTYAESVAVREQDLDGFRRSLGDALAIDPDKVPSSRLVNALAHEKARWLLEQIPELFLEHDGDTDNE
jgi:predicted anti-sigma-YlaC factor YlaD